MNIENIVREKAAGGANTSSEIVQIIHAYSDGKINDEDITLWLKAVYDNDMTDEEMLAVVEAMVTSGERLDFSHLEKVVVDKHSTGGVGDKVSLIIAPILAACGLAVPMISGRSLGHTGGTLDKLQSIPGYRIDLSLEEFRRTVGMFGLSLSGQTSEICPADKKMYTLRDKTGTVASTPLICGSIMSKKIAEGIEVLAMNITVGNGAFMKTMEKAKKLGKQLKMAGEQFGVSTNIVYSRMDQPLGREAGLWNEIQESVSCLKGEGEPDLMAVVTALAEPVLKHAGVKNPLSAIEKTISSGSALVKLEEMIEAHDGDPSSLHNGDTVHTPPFEKTVEAEKSGVVRFMDTEKIGWAVNSITVFDEKSSRRIDPSGGARFEKKLGEEVESGSALAVCHGSDKETVSRACRQIKSAVKIEDTPFRPEDVII
jgi:pyrimidine-nucleoside phosphorylase|tara:strand:- start:2612 stop:3892 length:1281 start_codon:yes stop_codon:yes gene_type:complete